MMSPSISDDTGFTNKDVHKFLDAAIEVITEILSGGDEVNLIGFGSFSAKIAQREPA